MKNNKKLIDIDYAASSFLQFRYLFGKFQFSEKLPTRNFSDYGERVSVENVSEVDHFIEQYILDNFDSKTILMLSGGIDSAILASYLPRGSRTLTFDTGNEQSKLEVINAKKYAAYYGLKHEVLNITWDDYLELTKELIISKGAPIHSIEVQIAKAALYAKELGYNKLLFGEAADVVFGGFDGLLLSDPNYKTFMNRYNYFDPRLVLNDGVIIDDFYRPYKRGSDIDIHRFLSEVFYEETLSSYQNACSVANIEFLTPFPYMRLEKLDYSKVRAGKSKYLLRDLYSLKYKDLPVAEKLPMPRAMDEWMLNWSGPSNKIFKKDFDFKKLTADRQWMIYCLDLLLNEIL